MFRDVAQPGSALAWGARGRKFESCRPDQLKGNPVMGCLFNFITAWGARGRPAIRRDRPDINAVSLKGDGFLIMSYFVYILKSLKDGKYYIGSTADVVARLNFHNAGLQRSTKSKFLLYLSTRKL